MLDLSQIKNILVSGGAGFIGSNFLNEFVPKFPNINFINLDKLTYAADLNNIKVGDNQNYKFLNKSTVKALKMAIPGR